MAENRSVLSIPAAQPRVRYERNFIKTAVCELRFPTLLELEKDPPRAFHKSVWKLYPLYEPQVIPVAGPESLTEEVRYLFRSKDKHWTVTVKSFAIALETTKYVDFEDFMGRLAVVVEKAKALIDSDFFTQIGLRYINWIPIEDGELAGWLKPGLMPPLGHGGLGEPRQFGSQIEGDLDDGLYTMRQGLRSETGGRIYVWDVDYSKENVEVDELFYIIKHFNATNFAFFSWSLGEKAIAALGKATPK